VVQQLVCEESNLHFDYCRRQSQGVGDGRTFKKYGRYTNMTVYGVHDKGIWNTKNFISAESMLENSNKLSEMFTMAGFNVNRLKMFILDDADQF
jgi:hypothetical protein